jgi:DNA topoisomerase IA
MMAGNTRGWWLYHAAATPVVFTGFNSRSCLLCQATSRRGALEVHEWHGVFRGEPAAFKMTSVIGHVYSLDFPPAYNSWDRVDPLELFDAQTVKSEANPKVSHAHSAHSTHTT